MGDFNQAAYEEVIPKQSATHNIEATLLGVQQDCICCYYLGILGEKAPFKARRKVMDESRYMIESGGIHEPLLIYIGTKPSRSEGSREKRKAKALEKNLQPSELRRKRVIVN